MSNLFNDVRSRRPDHSEGVGHQVLDTLNSFNDRISALEKSSAVSGQPIINPLPPGPWHVGDTLTITGQISVRCKTPWSRSARRPSLNSMPGAALLL